MRSKLVWRYWCEFCRKGGCGKHAMSIHERGCTLNPDRQCRMCKAQEEFHSPGLEYLRMMARNDSAELTGVEIEPLSTPQEVVERLMSESGGCPACVLAALRQTGKTKPVFIHARPDGSIHPFETPYPFDYKRACTEFWARVNETLERTDAYGY